MPPALTERFGGWLHIGEGEGYRPPYLEFTSFMRSGGKRHLSYTKDTKSRVDRERRRPRESEGGFKPTVALEKEEPHHDC